MLFHKEELKEIREEKTPANNKVSSDTTQKFIESKIKRRGTVAIKQPSKLELGMPDDKKMQNALNRYRKEPDKSPGTKYTTSGINSKLPSSKLKKPESMLKKPESKIKSPTNNITGLKSSMPTFASKAALKRPSTTKSSKGVAIGRQTMQAPIANPLNKSIKKSISPEQKQELEFKKKFDEEIKERKRKMMAERKLLLKKKLSAIKIQKFWQARARRRKVKLDHIKYNASIRIIQKWYKAIFGINKGKKQILEKCKTHHWSEVLRIQR